jgi:guanylate kinase
MRIAEAHTRRKGLLFVLSGPSGSGKDVVLESFLGSCPGVIKCVTATTRSPRKNEVPDKDYFFLSVDEFRRGIEAGEFLEYANVHGNLYGTPRKWVEDTLATGTDVILKIDVQGGLAVKNLMPQAIAVFLAPPTFGELESRLRNRLTETEDEIAKRLSDARGEIEHIPHYDYLIENESISDTADRLRCVILAERSRVL